MVEFDNNDMYRNYLDHGGYSPKELYITPKYSTFKEALTFYKHITVKHYKQIISPKLMEYRKSKKVKSIKVTMSGIWNVKKCKILKYNLNQEDMIDLDHLVKMNLL